MNNTLSFIENLIRASENNPEQNAFHIKDKDYSYSKFYQKVNQIAQVLIGLKKHQQKVGVIINNDMETYASMIAIWLTGNSYIPIDLTDSNSRQQTSLNQVKLDTLLTTQGVNTLNYEGVAIISTTILPRSEKELPAIQIQANDIAYVLFTSGTTGSPKAVPISYQNLDAFVDSFLDQGYDFKSTDRFLQMADLVFDMSIIASLIPLSLGACVVTIDPEEMKYLATYKALQEKEITVLITAPSTLQLLAPHYSEIDLPGLRYSFVGAEAYTEETAKAWNICSPNAVQVNLYGPSEGGIFASAYTLKGDAIKSKEGIVSLGKQVKNIELYLVSAAGKLVDNQEEGEAWISGNQVFRGYLDQSLNDNAFGDLEIDGKSISCYKTGDYMVRDEEGFLFYYGRKDQQIKVQGKRIELEEIEFYAHQLEGSFKAKAYCFKGEFNSQQIALFVDKNLSTAAIKAHLSQHLPTYMIPAKIIGVAEMPKESELKSLLE